MNKQKDYPIERMAKCLNVSRSGYYRWKSGKLSPKPKNKDLKDRIKKIFYDFNETYGSPRMTEELKSLGINVSENTVAKLMKDLGLVAKAKKKFKITTNSKHNKHISLDLLERNFSPKSFGEAWVSDITYISTGEGWLYLCTVIELYNREVIGWSIDKHMKADLVVQAFKMSCLFGVKKRGTIFHSDKGSQYASNQFRNELKINGFRQSMSKSSSYDNAVAESFFHTLKVEEVHNNFYPTRNIAKKEIRDYIENFYNTRRRHSHNGNKSPVSVRLSKNIA